MIVATSELTHGDDVITYQCQERVWAFCSGFGPLSQSVPTALFVSSRKEETPWYTSSHGIRDVQY